MTRPPAPSDLARTRTELFTVYRSGAAVTMRCGLPACHYAKTWPGPWQLRTLVNLAEQHTREQHSDQTCPDCRVEPGTPHADKCGARDSGQDIWPGMTAMLAQDGQS